MRSTDSHALFLKNRPNLSRGESAIHRFAMKAIDRSQLIERIREIEGLSADERSSLLELLRTTPKYGLV